MKKFLSIIVLTATVALVLSACKGGSNTNAVNYEDTVGLAKFQEWKYQNERQEIEEPTVVPHQHAAAPRRTTSTRTGTMSSSSSNNASTAPAKKGWSKAAKGAAIGGASGAVLGAVINKRNRVAGGVIGGVIGGGVGYGIGRSQDKKDGRN